MTTQLKLEGAGLLIVFTVLYFSLGGAWTMFLLAFLAPDLSFLCYLINPRVGAAAYNVMHHQGVFGALGVLLWMLNLHTLALLCVIFLAHSAFDRMLGYGLKYSDSFQHTHLGWIGKAAATEVA